MNYIRSGTFKSGTATNVDQGVSASVAGLDASLAFYQGTEGDFTLNGTARSEVFAYYLKVGSNAGYRFDGVLEFNAGGGNDLIDLTNSANPYPHDVTVNGGTGNDTIWSGPGDDDLYGGDGNDSVWGGAGDDYIYGGENLGEGSYDDARDTLYGGPGNDLIAGSNGDSIDGGTGNDTIIVGPEEVLILQGSINGGPGYDEFGTYGDLGLSGFPTATLTSIERISYAFSIFAADPATAVNFDFSNVDFYEVWYLEGSSAGDTIQGPKSADADPYYEGFSLEIYGNGGNDTITGGPEGEQIYGDAGQDLVKGGAGADSIYGSDGEGSGEPDQFYGDGGADWFIFWREFGDYETIHDFEQGTDTIALYNYYDDGEDLSFDLLDSRGLITQNGAFVEIDLRDFGGSILRVNGTVAQFDASDFEIGSIG